MSVLDTEETINAVEKSGRHYLITEGVGINVDFHFKVLNMRNNCYTKFLENKLFIRYEVKHE
jgi:hypothetical protein